MTTKKTTTPILKPGEKAWTRAEAPIWIDYHAYEGAECVEGEKTQPWFCDEPNGDVCSIVVPRAEDVPDVKPEHRRVCLALACKRTIENEPSIVGLIGFFSIEAAEGMVDQLKTAIAAAKCGEGIARTIACKWRNYRSACAALEICAAHRNKLPCTKCRANARARARRARGAKR